jgi:hypothetical protein
MERESNPLDAVPIAYRARAEVVVPGRLPRKQPEERQEINAVALCFLLFLDFRVYALFRVHVGLGSHQHRLYGAEPRNKRQAIPSP